MITARFVSRRSLGDAAIRWSEDALGWRFGFSHVGFLRTIDGVEYEYGARSHPDRSLTGKAGFQVRPADYAVFTREARVSIETLATEEATFWSAAEAMLGTPYAGNVIAGFVLGRGSRRPDGVVCSQAAALLLDSISRLPVELKGSEDRLDPEAIFYLMLGLRSGSNGAVVGG